MHTFSISQGYPKKAMKRCVQIFIGLLTWNYEWILSKAKKCSHKKIVWKILIFLIFLLKLTEPQYFNLFEKNIINKAIKST